MTPEQLARAVSEACAIAERIGARQPDAAALILDAVELATQELLVHACKGDRELAEQLHRRVHAKDQG
jgi:hypothetical protein